MKPNAPQNAHRGSEFRDFLTEDGLLPEVEVLALKRVVALQLQQILEQDQVTKTELASRMKTSRASLDRLLDPENPSLTVASIGKAAAALGRKVECASYPHELNSNLRDSGVMAGVSDEACKEGYRHRRPGQTAPSPFHCLGAGTLSTIDRSTSSTSWPLMAISGVSCTRWRSTGSAARLMSSGMTNPRPRIAAKALPILTRADRTTRARAERDGRDSRVAWASATA